MRFADGVTVSSVLVDEPGADGLRYVILDPRTGRSCTCMTLAETAEQLHSMDLAAAITVPPLLHEGTLTV